MKKINSMVSTIYVQKLPEKISKNNLRRYLYYMFNITGVIEMICIFKNKKLRGQAFIKFKDDENIENIIKYFKDIIFFNQKIDIKKGNSDCKTRYYIEK